MRYEDRCRECGDQAEHYKEFHDAYLAYSSPRSGYCDNHWEYDKAIYRIVDTYWGGGHMSRVFHPAEAAPDGINPVEWNTKDEKE